MPNVITTFNHFEPCRFHVGDIEFCGKYWRQSSPNPSPRKIIALHGWLDNCASFDVVAPRLNADVLCLDLAGHACSGDRSHLGAYNIWLDIPEILAIADQLGWQRFELLGHSRGAAIAFLLAATFPRRVSALICLDGIFPLVALAEKAPEQLFHSINTLNKQLAKKRNTYASFERAVQARESGMFPLANIDALMLAQRGVIEAGDEFFWRYDAKLMAPSEFRLTPEQLVAFADAIVCPLLLLLASDGIFLNNTETMLMLKNYSTWSVKTFEGGHHFHMHQQGETITNEINQFCTG
ncbi:MAG: alpha/beta hydrolase [Marinagarivorans sp.]|nr:alpha/beta hydrolase [Marinagarivorans sp.]